ncbi:hypothetical protein [Atopobacter phocae]|uniref:hypothetical protein n=1 Tax=Atopobacter phocae TaxID=136492 RepID=UPI00047099A9|nr:hypothetical protein [Atopobacter phocae]
MGHKRKMLLLTLATSLFLCGCDVNSTSNAQTEMNNQTSETVSKDDTNSQSSITNENITTKDTKHLSADEKIEWIMMDIKQQYNDEKIPATAFYFNISDDEQGQSVIEVRENHEDTYHQSDDQTSPLVGIYKITANGELTKLNDTTGSDEIIGTTYLTIDSSKTN